MKTILNVKFDAKVIPVPACYLFSDTGVHFFIHRQILQVYANDTVEYSEKLWTVAEYTTGVSLSSYLAKKSAKSECIDLINRHGIQKTVELLSKFDVINFEVEQVLSFATKQVPLPAKNLVLGKYYLANDVIAAAAISYNSERREYKFSEPLSEAKNWVKFANEVVLMPGYKATLGTAAKHGWDILIIKHDKGSYQLPLESDIPELRKALIEAFNVDGAGEHLRVTPAPKKKVVKTKMTKDPEVIGTDIIEPEHADLIVVTPPSEPAAWIDKDGISIELPAPPPREKISCLHYDPPVQENRMYIDRDGIVWEIQQTFNNKKPCMDKYQEPLQKLYERKDKAKEALYQEQLRLHKVIEGFGWGRGMRCVKVTPSFTREDKIKKRIEDIDEKIQVLTEKINSACQ